ncbi:MAG TPA: HAMP domain-containing sensor histidine kinase, partial [Coleofasciculaceae cyanobacterium]
LDSTLLILNNRLKPCGNNPGIKVIKDYDELPLVTCYPGQLNQVFMNIMSNAIDALENQPEPRIISIHTSLTTGEMTKIGEDKETRGKENRELARQGDALLLDISSSESPVSETSNLPLPTSRSSPQWVIIQIADNGLGMNQDVVERLFEPFFTTKPVGKGTGLGLAISYQIVVEKHKGILKCFSEPEQGTEFWIQIPLAPSVVSDSSRISDSLSVTNHQ